MSTEISDQQRTEYLELLRLLNTNRIDYNTRKWETLKHGQVTVGSLLAAGLAILGLYCPFPPSLCYPWILAGCFFALAGITAGRTMWTLRKQSFLLFIDEASLFKVAKFLELNRKIPADDRWITPPLDSGCESDEDLLPPKWRVAHWASDDEQSLHSYLRPRWLFGLEPLHNRKRTHALEMWAENKVAAHGFLKSNGFTVVVVALLSYALSVAAFLISIYLAFPRGGVASELTATVVGVHSLPQIRVDTPVNDGGTLAMIERSLPYVGAIAALGAWFVTWREVRRCNRVLMKMRRLSSQFSDGLAGKSYQLEIWIENAGIQMQDVGMSLVFSGMGKSGTIQVPIPNSAQSCATASTFLRGSTARFVLSSTDETACRLLCALRDITEQRPTICVFNNSFLVHSFALYSRWDKLRQSWNRISFRFAYHRRVGEGMNGRGVFKTYQSSEC